MNCTSAAPYRADLLCMLTSSSRYITGYASAWSLVWITMQNPFIRRKVDIRIPKPQLPGPVAARLHLGARSNVLWRTTRRLTAVRSQFSTALTSACHRPVSRHASAERNGTRLVALANSTSTRFGTYRGSQLLILMFLDTHILSREQTA